MSIVAHHSTAGFNIWTCKVKEQVRGKHFGIAKCIMDNLRVVPLLLITCLLVVPVESTNDEKTGPLIEYKGISRLLNP